MVVGSAIGKLFVEIVKKIKKRPMRTMSHSNGIFSPLSPLLPVSSVAESITSNIRLSSPVDSIILSNKNSEIVDSSSKEEEYHYCSTDTLAAGSTGMVIYNNIEYKFKVISAISPDAYRVKLFDSDNDMYLFDFEFNENELNFDNSYILV